MNIYLMREERYNEMAATMHTVEHVYIWSPEHVKKLLTTGIKSTINVYDNVASLELIVLDLARVGVTAYARQWGVIEVAATKPLAPVYDIANCKYLKHRGKSAWDEAKKKITVDKPHFNMLGISKILNHGGKS